jgi:hypothetical protein
MQNINVHIVISVCPMKSIQKKLPSFTVTARKETHRSMSTHISKYDAGEEPPMKKKRKSNAESFGSASESRYILCFNGGRPSQFAFHS